MMEYSDVFIYGDDLDAFLEALEAMSMSISKELWLR